MVKYLLLTVMAVVFCVTALELLTRRNQEVMYGGLVFLCMRKAGRKPRKFKTKSEALDHMLSEMREYAERVHRRQSDWQKVLAIEAYSRCFDYWMMVEAENELVNMNGERRWNECPVYAFSFMDYQYIAMSN